VALHGPAATIGIEHPLLDAPLVRLLRQLTAGGKLSERVFQLASPYQAPLLAHLSAVNFQQE
jgi:hypothetical protein